MCPEIFISFAGYDNNSGPPIRSKKDHGCACGRSLLLCGGETIFSFLRKYI